MFSVRLIFLAILVSDRAMLGRPLVASVYGNHDVHSSSTTGAATTTLVGTLVHPFDGCLMHGGSSHDDQEGDIDMDCLISACTRLKDVMYQLGQEGNARDLHNNLVKIEQARAAVPARHGQTLRSLLEYEKKTGVKQSGGRLKNPSAAVGLLWIRRSVAFQRRMNSILLERPHLSSTTAALEAYHEELEPYHSWGLQKVYKMAFRATTPPRSKIISRFLGRESTSTSTTLDANEEAMTIRDLRILLDTWQPVSTVAERQ